jgi:hypothetical protein
MHGAQTSGIDNRITGVTTMGIYTIPTATAEYACEKDGIWYYDFYLDRHSSDAPRGRFEVDSTTWRYKLTRLPRFNAICYQAKEILELFVDRIQSAAEFEQRPQLVRLMLKGQARQESTFTRVTGSRY